MATVVGNGGLEGLPSLQGICDLYRSIVNDSFDAGAGQINTNDAPWMKPFLNSAIRDLYSDLRLVSDMKVVKDNAIIAGIPALSVVNPANQVKLTYGGYYDGSTWNNSLLLPSDLMTFVKVWQRPSNTGAPFFPMQIAAAGLESTYQDATLGMYEVRGNNDLVFNGSTVQTDIRLRYVATFPDIVGANVDFTQTYVPIQDCTNAVAFKMVAYYAQRLSPDQFSLAESQASKYTRKLIAESVRNSQTKQFASIPFGV